MSKESRKQAQAVKQQRIRAQKEREKAIRVATAPPAVAPEPAPSIWKRLTRRFVGVPGAGVGLGFFQILWRIFKRGEDLQFSFDLWRAVGGDIPMVIQVVSSPLFGLSLIVAGIAYAIFAKEPEEAVSPAIPILGWSVVAICGLILGSVVLFDSFLVQSHVASFVSNLTAQRHITEDQKNELKRLLAPIAASFPRTLAVCAADDPEASGYAIELMSALAYSGLKVFSMSAGLLAPLPMRVLSPGVEGIFFQVEDPKSPPQEVKTLGVALRQAGLPIGLYRNTQLKKEDYMLCVGLK